MTGGARKSKAIEIRGAEGAHDAALTAIFNREIGVGTALWNTVERSVAEMADWRLSRQSAGFPVLVALDADGALLGYGSFGRFRPHDGYAQSMEHSVYVAPEAQRRGVGRALLHALEAAARARGAHVMIGGVDADNAASIALHLAEGFVETARMPEVGRKFDRWLTLVLLQKQLT